MLLAMLAVGIGGMALSNFYLSLNRFEAVLFIVASIVVSVLGAIFAWDRFSKVGRENRKRIERIREIPPSLLNPGNDGVKMGVDQDLKIPIYLPDSLRSRHIHILGATGSGKTESVVLNFLRQDVERGMGSIVLDAKGDASFLWSLKKWVPKGRLKVFDLSSEDSLSYNPLEAGTPLEAAQRLFSSLVWSEEYYKSKAFSALQRLFQKYFEDKKRNPRLSVLADYLDDPETFSSFAASESYPKKLAEKNFSELSGLRDQIKTLSIGHLAKILSPEGDSQMKLEDAYDGTVLYFRLQSLLSPQLVSTLGKLLINHLNFLAGTAHRVEGAAIRSKLIPTYLDEFASFACPEFADLISKARSAGLALHFSHQSVGDLAEVSKGFINRITDNSATKIILRISDPDSADYFARSFGTKLYQKITHRITNVKETDPGELVGEGSQREAHQFRSPPDLFKTLPTGVGSVLVAHGYETPHGASTVFRIRFPRLSD